MKKNNEVLNKVNPYDSHVYGSTVFSPPNEHTHTQPILMIYCRFILYIYSVKQISSLVPFTLYLLCSEHILKNKSAREHTHTDKKKHTDKNSHQTTEEQQLS